MNNDISKYLVSVILPVYNGEKYIKEAVDSILKQSHKFFELIIINDGSSDKTLDIINSIKDKRIVIFNLDHKGLIEALNFGISKAKGNYIARMDSDDISSPKRIEKQLKTLLVRKADICGCSFYTINSESFIKRSYLAPFTKDEIFLKLAINVPFCHGSVLAKKDIFLKYKYGSIGANLIEDYCLWLKMYQEGVEFINADEKLYFLRLHSESLSNRQTSIFNLVSTEFSLRFISNNIKRLSSIINSINIRKHIFRRISSSDSDYFFLSLILLKYRIMKINFKNLFILFILILRKNIYNLFCFFEISMNHIYRKSIKNVTMKN